MRQVVQLEVAIEPWTSITRSEPALLCRRSMFWVITASSSPRASSSASASWAPFGLLVGRDRRSAAGRSSRSASCRGGRRRCGRPPSDRPSPRAPCRGCGSRGSRTAPRSPRRSARRPSSPRGSAPRARRAPPRLRLRACSPSHFPCHFGARLPRNAPMPSLRVLGLEGGREAGLLVLDPLVEVGIVGGLLDLLDRDRRLARRACAPRRAPCRTARGRARPGSRARRPPPRRLEIASPIRFISSAFS